MSLNLVAFEPMLRAMGLAPSLARYFPTSRFLPLQTLLLRDCPLVHGLDARWDDSCFVTLPQDAPASWPWERIKLSVARRGAAYSGVHLAFMSLPQQLQMSVSDDHTKLVVGHDVQWRGQLNAHGRPTVVVGDGAHLSGVRMVVGQFDLVVGDDCLLGEEVLLQAQDPYPLVDLSTQEVLNTGRGALHLSSHVLVGRRALLLGRTEVGAGSVVSAGAVVEGAFDRHVLLGGSPAQVQRQQISWARGFGQTAPHFEAPL